MECLDRRKDSAVLSFHFDLWLLSVPFSEGCWLKKETGLKKLYTPAQLFVYLNGEVILWHGVLNMLLSLRSTQLLPLLTVCQELHWQRQEIISTSYNQHSGMNTVTKSRYIWNSSVLAVTLLFDIFPNSAIVKCHNLLQAKKMTGYEFHTYIIGIHPALVHGFWVVFGSRDKRSMTLNIPLHHDSALTSCSHVDSMWCFDFCFRNLYAKQDGEQKSSPNASWSAIFLALISSWSYAPDNIAMLSKQDIVLLWIQFAATFCSSVHLLYRWYFLF